MSLNLTYLIKNNNNPYNLYFEINTYIIYIYTYIIYIYIYIHSILILYINLLMKIKSQNRTHLHGKTINNNVHVTSNSTNNIEIVRLNIFS